MESIINEELLCKEYIETSIGVEALGTKYHVGKKKIKEILLGHGVEMKGRGGQNILSSGSVNEPVVEKYPPKDGIMYYAVDRKNGTRFDDVKMNSIKITNHILSTYSVTLPTLYDRKKYYLQSGNYWWEQWLDVHCVDEHGNDRSMTDQAKNITNIVSKAKEKVAPVKASTKRLTWDVAVERMKAAHPDEKLEYPAQELTDGVRTKIRVIDHDLKPDGTEYGEYTIEVRSHIAGNGYPGKKRAKNAEKRKVSWPDLVARMKLSHPNENLEYPEQELTNGVHTKIRIIDHDLRPDGTEYGPYFQTPSNHLKGHGHPDKRADKISRSKRMDWKTIVERCRAAHPNEELEYPEQEVRNLHDKIRIIDHDLRPDGTGEYGEYVQELNSHIRGCGHPQKAIDKNAGKQRYDTQTFICLAMEVHKDDDYDYSECHYVDHREKVKIFCNKLDRKGHPHGFFLATPDNFLQGKGCPKCGNHLSHAEDEIIAHLRGLGVECEHNNHSVLDGLEIDIYCPAYKFGIEYNGLRWHTEKYGKDRYYHVGKTNKAEENGVRLVQVFEDEWIHNKQLVLDKIDILLGMSKDRKVIGARKCSIREIGKGQARDFLEANHIQGWASSTVYYGAFSLDSALLGVMSFKICSEGWELTRFATAREFSVPGLGSKMFKHFVLEHHPNLVKSFADRRWTLDKDSNMYTKIGFVLEEVEKPDYRYVVGNERKHKFLFRKHILSKKYGLPLTMTESEMCGQLGFERIWDCGLIKYVWRNND